MNCPECGRVNNENNRFCIYCGADMNQNHHSYGESIVNAKKIAKKTVSLTKEKEIPAAKSATQRVAPILKKYRVAIICVAAVVLAISLFFGICSSLSKPERVVKQYFNAMIAGDYEKAYNYLNVGENEFITKESFIKYIKSSQIDYSNISDFEIKDIKDNSNNNDHNSGSLFENHGGFSYDEENDENNSENLITDFKKDFKVACVTSADETYQSFVISAYKQDKNFMLFFPSYKVAAKELIGNYSIIAPSDFVVKVDGIKLNGKPTGDSDTLGLVYSTGSIFRGEHELTLEHPLIETYKDTIYIGDSSYDDDDIASISSLRMNPTAKKEVFETGKALLNKLINGALAGKAFDSLKIDCVNNNEQLDKIRDAYESFSRNIKSSDGKTGLQKVTITNVTDRSEQKNISSEAFYTCKLEYEYKYVRTYEDYWDDEIVSTDGQSISQSYLVFKYENGKWLLYNIDKIILSY